MDKTILRNVIKGLLPKQEINVRMRSSATPENFTVIEVKKGRGKHGSLSVAMIKGDGTVITMGTPENQKVLNVTVNGEFFGVNNEREDPPTYRTDDANATNIKAALHELVGEAGKGRNLRLESTVPEFQGTFAVMNGRLEKGKYGQVHLWLCPVGQAQTADNTVEFWSYRHSGVVTGFEILPV